MSEETKQDNGTDVAASIKPVALESATLFEKLREKFGEEVILDHVEGVGDPIVVIRSDSILDVMNHLFADDELKFDFLSDVTAIDWPDDNIIESSYHIYSMTHRHMLVVKVKLPRDSPEVESVSAIWPAADWHEREQFDLMGVIYKNHPNLRRILLAEDWEGHPLRKDYVIPDEIHGVSNLP